MKIQIDFDRKNAGHLLKAVFMYGWVMNAAKVPEEMDASVEEFEQYILAQLYNGGVQDHILYKSDEGVYALADGVEEDFYQDVMAYTSDTFWEDLADRLAERDLEEQKQQPQTEEEFFQLHTGLVEGYNKEFETSGLKNLRLK